MFGVPSNQMQQRSTRVRSVASEPFSYSTTYGPESSSPTFTQQGLGSRPLWLAAADVAGAPSVAIGTMLTERRGRFYHHGRAPHACAVPAGPLRLQKRPVRSGTPDRP